MISVAEAKRKIIENCPAPKIIQVPLAGAGGFVLAENLFAPMDAPHYNQSAMDGYAFAYNDWDRKSGLDVIGEVQAGNTFKAGIKPMQALRIFTGAAVPPSADTVVIQENVQREDNVIFIKDPNLLKGNNVRIAGSQTKKADLVLQKGHLLTPASIALLAGLGISYVHVFSLPSVSIIATGKELLKHGECLVEGKIYESNSFGLNAVLHQMGIFPSSIQIVDDNETEICRAINNQLHVDILLITGGVSVGDYDFVIAALKKCAVKTIFHKVKQKPGKPLFFGTCNQSLVFGLPGNPASVLTCFYEYVAEAIKCYTQNQFFNISWMPLSKSFSKKAGLTFFLKGKIFHNKIEILDSQESYKMNSFALADGIIELEEPKEKFEQNEMVRVRVFV
ncbi:MAG: molybdopterin molybdotransferase MoeA [Chitinophagaceae bacterium]|nr:molybdopterin molybdotransferase MoeA [Chitinophagaceae bacterium]MBP6046103.1 molybdopterin molybdotransferase MoeA [Ferruginibacter sp.]MBK7088528.1 molybdopterin molybdotransferase MoeA [Chitinophagaceae bacterium]MBK7345565.1 molybdopterin molybdotransferase MoeA [Chitinophagaceae bacterium]MBK7734945.1 molybdopterin molybdotransferase MoeA [Chitinophagaceae bacterium]